MEITKIEFNAIAAMCNENRGIAMNNELPWSIAEDHEYYQRVVKTTRDSSKINAIILGRLTWETFTEPMERCLNIIVSTTLNQADIKCNANANADLVRVCRSLNEAKQLIYDRFADRVETIWSLGGSDLYRKAIESSDFNRFYLTRVFGKGKIECDRFLEPDNFLENFIKMENLEQESVLYKCDFNTVKTDPKCGLEYIFEVYQKKN